MPTMRPVNDSPDRYPCEKQPDLWFSELRRDKRLAKQQCAACPFMQGGRDEAIERHLAGVKDDGIWGATDLAQRKLLAEQRRPEKHEASAA